MNAKTALVVDDSKSARFAMRKFLESFGYQVDTAESAEDAYIYLRKKLPEVMFLDHIMPGTDGFEAIKAIKQNALTAGLPVVLCSSNEGDDFLRQARVCGAIDVLQKPPSPDQIRSVLDNLKRLQDAAPPAALAPAAPSKVQSIREPEVAIEQAVMKNLRDALPPAALAPLAAAPRFVAPQEQPMAVRGPVPRDESAPRIDNLREEMEARLRKITQDLFVQIGEIRAQLAHVEGAAQSSRDEQHLQDMVVRAMEPQLDSLSRNVDTLLARLRGDVDELLAAQNQRIDQLGQSLRQAVIEEAHAVSERVMMNAAQRISDQIAESILRVLKPAAAQG
ncbi:response regulator [Nevskia soli]|uniref:response regulator n=1 Tax=Nevskia soli TaxID=418856 RepID=UPI0004A78753|nr:response regulator [Nevskia soli]